MKSIIQASRPPQKANLIAVRRDLGVRRHPLISVDWPPRTESLQIKRACSLWLDHLTKRRSVLSGNQLSGLGSLNSLGNGRRRTSLVSSWRMYISPGVAYATYLPSGDITAQMIGASGELAVIRLSTAGFDGRNLTRITIPPATATTARGINKTYQRRYWQSPSWRPACSRSCCFRPSLSPCYLVNRSRNHSSRPCTIRSKTQDYLHLR